MEPTLLLVPVENGDTVDPADIATYLREKGFAGDLRVAFLAAGEYNENYLVETESERLVFRINHGSQLSLDRQIEYEFSVLSCISGSGVTPSPVFVDAGAPFGQGALVMQHLPGGPFDYTKDAAKAAMIFARVHAVPENLRVDQPDEVIVRSPPQQSPTKSNSNPCVVYSLAMTSMAYELRTSFRGLRYQ